MAPVLGQRYDAVCAGSGLDKARVAAEEVAGFPIAVVLGVFALQWQILLRLPS
jgi:hypothetical protein